MKVEPTKPCSKETCEKSALTFSHPALCANHVNDIDEWYISARKAIKDLKGDEKVRFLYASLAHSEYMAAISDDPIDDELYKDFIQRAERPSGLAFSVDHFITALADFYITCAVSGIIGNFSYDAVKAGVSRVLGLLHKKPRANDDRFDEIVEREKYEEISRRFHLKMPFVEIDRETEKRITKRYRNIVEDGFEKNSDLLFRRKRKTVAKSVRRSRVPAKKR
jgi:hypothetical protein